VGIANIVDVNLIKSGSAIRTATICFYASNEAISILENCVKVGLPIPEKLKQVLEQFGKEVNEDEKNNKQ
jgi:toxin secretion/phage lysis holin